MSHQCRTQKAINGSGRSVEMRIEYANDRWFLVMQGQTKIAEAQIHFCPWCGVRLLMKDESLSDLPGEPGSYAHALNAMREGRS